MQSIQKILGVILLLVLFNHSFSQTTTIDSLESLYNSEQNDSLKFELLANVYNLYYTSNDTINANRTIDRLFELVYEEDNELSAKYIYHFGNFLENYQSNYERAIKVYKLALERARTNKT